MMTVVQKIGDALCVVIDWSRVILMVGLGASAVLAFAGQVEASLLLTVAVSGVIVGSALALIPLGLLRDYSRAASSSADGGERAP